MGMKNEPKMREGILISGLPFPPFLSANYLQDGHKMHYLETVTLTVEYILVEICPPNMAAITYPMPGPM
jgi:hypothetical protein